MKNYIVTTLLCLTFLLPTKYIFSQQDSVVDSASINTLILDEYNKKIAELEIQRIQDSTKRATLEAQILSIKNTDNLKREELQKQLEYLNNKETLRLTEKKIRIDSLRITAKKYPVIGFFNDTLFYIYSNLGSFSAPDRAEAIRKRIDKLSETKNFNADSLLVIESETMIDIVFENTIIMSVSENDALWNNSTKHELAKLYQEIISKAIVQYKTEISFSTLSKQIGLAIFVLVIFYIILTYTKKLFRWVAAKIIEQKDKRIKGIKIRNYTLFDTSHQVKFLLSINQIVKWFLIILLVYITLPILFGIFPWTKDFAATLFSYILYPAKKMGKGFMNYLPNLITIVVTVVIFHYILKGIAFLKNEIENEHLKISGFYSDWANPTYQIIRVVIYAFMIIVIFPYLPGSDSPVFKGVSVFLGVLFTFGSSGSLSNVVAGLVLTYMRLFTIGDRVKIGEVIGDVIEKSMLVTRIRTIKNEIISIPNSTVMNSHTINYSSEAAHKGLIMHTTVTIGYDAPWKNVHQALQKAADRTEFLLKEPKPFVLQTSLDDFYVSYQINAYTKDVSKQATIYSELHCNIQDCCNETGIEILSPHYRSARDGNATSIPSEYLDKNYKAPSFNVNVNNDSK